MISSHQSYLDALLTWYIQHPSNVWVIFEHTLSKLYRIWFTLLKCGIYNVVNLISVLQARQIFLILLTLVFGRKLLIILWYHLLSMQLVIICNHSFVIQQLNLLKEKTCLVSTQKMIHSILIVRNRCARPQKYISCITNEKWLTITIQQVKFNLSDRYWQTRAHIATECNTSVCGSAQEINMQHFWGRGAQAVDKLRLLMAQDASSYTTLAPR